MICRYPADWVAPHTSLKSRQRMRHASTCHHIPYSSELCPLARVGSDATTCSMAPDPAPLLGRAPVLPRVLQLWTSPSDWGGPRCCHMPPWLRTLPPCWRELRRRRVFYGSGHRLPTGKGFGVAMHPAVPYRLRASSIKKGLADLPMQLGSRVSKPCAHVPNVPDARAIMGLQDVQASGTIIACKTCGQAATV
jgi:hypothetical protein